MSTIEKRSFIITVINELADIFPMRLTDISKKSWVEELVGYSEERILKAKKLLIREHKGFIYPKDFHEAISAFPKEQKQEIESHKTIPMPESFKSKFLKIQEDWSK